ncbi:UNVERIFIED_CONTAM: hypothetical protein HDU68_007875 [Siphonaria sp. JEL0065]|nr:hypothetical protein HDU68_007875 [Siphonaria sp. JEL0065]
MHLTEPAEETPPPLVSSVPEFIRIGLLVLFLAVVGGSTAALRSSRPPVAALTFQEAIATNDFPGLDAYQQLKNIAQIPHPQGSAENLRVYTYLLDTLNSYKNTSNVEMQVLEFDQKLLFPQLMVYFPGTVANSSLMLSSHFDSGFYSPGASDDGAATTVMLQIARLMSLQQVQPRNSLLLFFNNGEEFGLLGSRKLLQNTPNAWKPLVSSIKAFVNLEGGGTGGKPIMLRANCAKLAQAYANLPYPHMNSFGGDILGFLGSYTDYQNYVASGIPGLDVAYYQNRRFYHTSDDSLDHISANDVQYMGSNTLSITRTLLGAPWIDELKIESRIAFYDHFGFSPLVIAVPFQMALLGTMSLGLVAMVVYGYFVIYRSSSWGLEEETRKTLFFKSCGNQLLYGAFAVLASVVWSIVLAIPALILGGVSKNSVKGAYLIIPISFVGCIVGSCHLSKYWRENYGDKDVHRHSTMQLYVGVLLGSVLAIIFLAFNLPLLYIVAFGALARLISVAALTAKKPNSKTSFAFEISSTLPLLIFGTIIAVSTFYPLLLLVDFLVAIANLGVGNLYIVVVFLLCGCLLGGAMLSTMIPVKSSVGGKVVKFGCVVLAVGFSAWMAALVL